MEFDGQGFRMGYQLDVLEQLLDTDLEQVCGARSCNTERETCTGHRLSVVCATEKLYQQHDNCMRSLAAVDLYV